MIADGFPLRLGILLGLMGLGLLLDRRLPPERRRRYRDYGLILAGGVIGAGLGMAVDALTVRIGPEYHLIAKGLEPGPGLHAAALRLGAEAGAVGGIIAGALLVFAVGTRRPERWHLRILATAAGVAGLTALAGLGIQMRWEPLAVGVIQEHLDPEPAARFHRAWATHLGAYAGGAIALVWAMVAGRRVNRCRSDHER